MQLSKRLQAVANFVTSGNRVADVGCDHAYTSIYLAENGISPHIIAMDVNQGPIERAKDNIVRYGYQDKIEVRKSNGLEKLELGEVETVLIAGMGGALTAQILSEHKEIMDTVRELVLQPQSEINKVRQMLNDSNFLITDENMIKEDGKYYVMMKAVPAKLIKECEPYRIMRKEHFYYGRLLLENNHPVLSEFLLWDMEICKDIMKSLELEESENSRLRKKEIIDRINLINCGLSYFANYSLKN